MKPRQTPIRIGLQRCVGYFAIGFAILAVGDNAVFAQGANMDFLGVWEAEQDYNDAQSKTLIIRRAGDELEVSVGSARKKVKHKSGLFAFELPDGSGKFRGSFSSDGKSVRGFWIQPSTRNLNYPLATPLRFENGPEGWQAKVRPYHDRMRMYLVVSKPEGKPIEAFIRNPERNVGMRLGYMLVEANETEFNLRQMRGSNVFKGSRSKTGSVESLVIRLPYSNKPFVFRKSKREAGSAFYPSFDSSPYRYSQPTHENDGWATAKADDLGLDVTKLESLVQDLRETETKELTTPYIHSLLISRSGKLVLEEYFYGFDKHRTHDTRSAGKSPASMLIGAVIDKNDSLDENKTLADIFGKDFVEPKTSSNSVAYEQRAAWRKRVTIAHALAMQSGLDADDDRQESPGNEGVMQDQTAEPNWARYGLSVPMIREPGSKSLYSSNNINVAAAAISKATEQWLPDLFETHLADPMEIKHYHFNLDPAENGYMGGGIRLTPRDQLKLGQVMIDGGKWNGKQVISQRWVKETTSPHGSMNEPNDYGMGWWRKTLSNNDQQVEVFHASGNGGQMVVCVPEHEIVIQMSGGNYGNFPTWYRNLTELIPQKILPAIK